MALSGIPTWGFELALRLKHDAYGVARFEEILRRAENPPSDWNPSSDAEYISVCLANEMLTPENGYPA